MLKFRFRWLVTRVSISVRERIIASHGWIMVSVSSIYGQVSLPVARWIRYHQPPVAGLHYQHFINSQDF